MFIFHFKSTNANMYESHENFPNINCWVGWNIREGGRKIFQILIAWRDFQNFKGDEKCIIFSITSREFSSTTHCYYIRVHGTRLNVGVPKIA